MTKILSSNAYEQIDKALSKFPKDKRASAVMFSLMIAQREYGWLSSEIIEELADYLEMPAIAVQEVASFYTLFRTKPAGKYCIAVCTNLPCALAGANETVDYVKNKLGIDFGETTKDGLFTLIESECMGACGDAPVMSLNQTRLCSRMTRENIDKLLEGLK